MLWLDWRQDYELLGKQFVEITKWPVHRRKAFLELITPFINQWRRRKLTTIGANAYLWSEPIRKHMPTEGFSKFVILYEIAVLKPDEIDQGISEKIIRPDCKLEHILNFKRQIGRRSK